MPEICLDPLCRHTVWMPLPQPQPQPQPQPRPTAQPKSQPLAPRPPKPAAAAPSPAPSLRGASPPRAGEAVLFRSPASLRAALARLPRASLEGVVDYPTMGSAAASRSRTEQYAFLAARGALVHGATPLPSDSRVLLLHRGGLERTLAAAADVAAAQGSVSPKSTRRAAGIDHVDDGAAAVRGGVWVLKQGQIAGEAVLRQALADASLAVFHWRDGEGTHVRAFRYANYIVGVEQTGAGTGRMLTRWEWHEMSRADARRVLALPTAVDVDKLCL